MVTLLIALAIQSSATPEVSTIDQIPELKAKVSMDDGMMPLSEFASQIELATHVHLTLAKDIQDRKVGAFFTDRPAVEVMHRLETTLFVQWQQEKAGLRLVLPSQIKREERSMIDAENTALRNVTANRLKAWERASHEPYETVRDEVKELQASYDSLEADKSPAGVARTQQALEELLDLEPLQYSKQAWDVGSILASSGPNAADDLVAGRAIAASTDRVPGALQISAESNPTGNTTPPDHYVSLFFIDPSTGQLNIATHIVGKEPTFASVSSVAYDMRSDRRVADVDRQEPLYKRLVAWSKADDTAVMDAPVPHGTEFASPWLQKTFTASDQLGWLARTTGIPILCDAYRIPATFGHTFTAATVREWLTRLDAPIANSQIQNIHGRVRTEQGWLLFRHGHYWRYLDSEIPEKTLRPLEQATRREPTFDTYAEFAGNLTSEQESRMEPAKMVTRFPLMPLIGNVPALRLWNDLPSSQRELASRGFLPAGDMSPSSQQFYTRALYFLAYKSGVPSPFLLSLLPGVPLPSGLGLMVRHTDSSHQAQSSATEEVLEPDSNGMLQYSKMYRFEEVIFGLGSNTGGSINYMITTSPGALVK